MEIKLSREIEKMDSRKRSVVCSMVTGGSRNNVSGEITIGPAPASSRPRWERQGETLACGVHAACLPAAAAALCCDCRARAVLLRGIQERSSGCPFLRSASAGFGNGSRCGVRRI